MREKRDSKREKKKRIKIETMDIEDALRLSQSEETHKVSRIDEFACPTLFVRLELC